MKIEEVKYKFLDGLELTTSRPIKRPISKEFKIVTTECMSIQRWSGNSMSMI